MALFLKEIMSSSCSIAQEFKVVVLIHSASVQFKVIVPVSQTFKLGFVGLSRVQLGFELFIVNTSLTNASLVFHALSVTHDTHK